MGKGGAVNTEARGGFRESSHVKLRKYRIKKVACSWAARVPYGTWHHFDTWGAAARFLAERHDGLVWEQGKIQHKARLAKLVEIIERSEHESKSDARK